MQSFDDLFALSLTEQTVELVLIWNAVTPKSYIWLVH